jgi:putative hydrolase of the HAD superfamily
LLFKDFFVILQPIKEMGMIKGIIFDLDNTLLDFVKMKEVAVDSAVTAMIDAGLAMSKDEAKEKIYWIYDEQGIEFQEVFDQFLMETYGAINYRILSAGVVAYRRAREAALVLYPHVTYTLTQLIKGGYKLAVLSDAPGKQAWLRLSYLNLHHFFDTVITFEDTGERKPSTLPFQKALDVMELGPEQVLMVGDWPERDMVGAKKLGIRTVFARYGDTFETKNSGANYDIDDISELLTIVKELGDAG